MYPLHPEAQLDREYLDYEQALESESERRAEFGMSYVCGGGQASDAMAAYGQYYAELPAPTGPCDALIRWVAEHGDDALHDLNTASSPRELEQRLAYVPSEPVSDDPIPF